MTRNLKALGLILAAVFAMSAVIASSASAGQLTSTGKVKITATETKPTLTAFGLGVTCEKATYHIGNVNETPHGFITPPVTTVTVQPTYEGKCHTIEPNLPATVTMNGCDFVLHIGALIVAGKYAGTADIVCPAGKEIEVHAYTNEKHESSICTIKLPAQNGLANGFVQNIAGGTLTVGGPVKGIHATKTGLLCGGTAETNTGEQDIDAVATGTNEAGLSTEISVSGS